MKRFFLILITLVLAAAAFSTASARSSRKTETVTYQVNIHCQNCVDKLTDNLSFIKGVEDLRISLKDKTVTIKYNPAKVQEPKLAQAISKLGYTAVKKK